MNGWLPETDAKPFFGVDRTPPPEGWFAARPIVKRPLLRRLWRSLLAGLHAVRNEWKWGAP